MHKVSICLLVSCIANYATAVSATVIAATAIEIETEIAAATVTSTTITAETITAISATTVTSTTITAETTTAIAAATATSTTTETTTETTAATATITTATTITETATETSTTTITETTTETETTAATESETTATTETEIAAATATSTTTETTTETTAATATITTATTITETATVATAETVAIAADNNILKVNFQNGDIVFRKGTSAKTRAVLYADTNGIYSHTGIVASTPNGFKIIHITPGERKKGETADRIKMENIEEFFAKNRARHGAVYRLSCSMQIRSAAAKQALRLLNKRTLFDHTYKLDDTTTMYCTELIYYVYKLAGKDITFGKRSKINAPMYSGTYIFPSDIYKNKEFELIYKF
ncbi:MAG: hypothetical protein LBF01_04525 [Bacteroidales bacterium]|jgi:hypothetical protein|nr:hypothetical protein [Bacteroidales bacterium]